MRLALQQVPLGLFGTDCGHAGKPRKDRKFRQAVALKSPGSVKADRLDYFLVVASVCFSFEASAVTSMKHCSIGLRYIYKHNGYNP
jgi:hypothetical protein